MHHLFIYLFICCSNGMAALLLCYHFTALCVSKGDIRASAICYFCMFFLVHYCIGKPSQAFRIAFISLCSLCCNMLSANDSEVVVCEHEHTLLWPSKFLQVSLDCRCCGQGPPVPILGIINSNNLYLNWFVTSVANALLLNIKQNPSRSLSLEQQSASVILKGLNWSRNWMIYLPTLQPQLVFTGRATRYFFSICLHSNIFESIGI